MEYWTIKEGRHAGPFTAMQLADMGIAPDTPVWHEGLTDWVPAREIAEIAAIMVARQNGAAQAQPCQPQAPAPVPEYEYVRAQDAPAQASHAPLRREHNVADTPAEECPPAYLAWSIISMLICCIPLGVVAIIFSAQVKPAWRQGDIAKARRASERAQWCIILSISLGLIFQFFYGAFVGASGLG